MLHNKYVNHDTAPRGTQLGEVNDKPSMTVPDMVPTIQELMDRYVRQVDVPVKQGQFTEDVEFASVARMTPLERAEKAREVRLAKEKAREDLYQRSLERKREKEEREKMKERVEGTRNPGSALQEIVDDQQKPIK